MTRTKQAKKKSSLLKRSLKMRTTSVMAVDSAEDASMAIINELLSAEYDNKAQFRIAYDAFVERVRDCSRQSYEKACDHVTTTVTNILGALPDSAKYASHSTEIPKDFFNDQNVDPNVSFTPSERESRSRRRESFDFKKPKTPIRPTQRTSKKRSVSVPAPSAPSNDAFKTPLMSNRRIQAGTTITPKIYCDTPMAMMRRPLHGELAVSLSGSPLMVSAVSREDIPTVNVPLNDGRVFSILAEPGAPPPDLPNFDETTRNYLKTLQEHLAILVPSDYVKRE